VSGVALRNSEFWKRSFRWRDEAPFAKQRRIIMKKSTTASALLVSALTLIPTLAHAHPGHGSGFATGVTHPLTGLDHALAMVAVGLWAAQLGGRARWAVPAAFVGVMMAGSALGMTGVTMPMVDSAILCSMMILGLLVTSAVRVPLAASVAIVGAFAAVHGLAHGMEIPATASGIGYTGGFALSTAALHGVGLAFGAMLQRAAATGWVRVAGAAVALTGAMLAAS
jgi:urease accessory protein